MKAWTGSGLCVVQNMYLKLQADRADSGRMFSCFLLNDSHGGDFPAHTWGVRRGHGGGEGGGGDEGFTVERAAGTVNQSERV